MNVSQREMSSCGKNDARNDEKENNITFVPHSKTLKIFIKVLVPLTHSLSLLRRKRAFPSSLLDKHMYTRYTTYRFIRIYYCYVVRRVRQKRWMRGREFPLKEQESPASQCTHRECTGK